MRRKGEVALSTVASIVFVLKDWYISTTKTGCPRVGFWSNQGVPLTAGALRNDSSGVLSHGLNALFRDEIGSHG
jgi:hypothetical protein